MWLSIALGYFLHLGIERKGKEIERKIIQKFGFQRDKGIGKHYLPTRLEQTLVAIWCTMFLGN